MLSFRERAVEELSIAHEVAIDPATGAATLRVPVPAPGGRGGLGPTLALTYSSQAGSSVYGVGWSLAGLPTIGIDVQEHVPRWDRSDTFHLGGVALVPWLEDDGDTWRLRGVVDDRWSVAYYRPRLGAARVRVEKWVSRATGRVHFRTRDARNVLTVFGARLDGTSRVADPDDAARTFLWMPEIQIEPTGNAVWFEHLAETVDGVDRSLSYEHRRVATAQRYLKRIQYGNVTPLELDEALLTGAMVPATRWCFQLVFDYGDHSDADRPAAAADRPWPARIDPLSSHRPGFDLRTHRLCRRILAFHDFEELGVDPTLVGALVLEHDPAVDGSTLRRIRQIGYRREGAAVVHAELPPLELRHATAAVEHGFLAAPTATLENAADGRRGRQVQVDLDGDGLPGLLTENDDAWFYKPNLGGGHFGAAVLVAERPATRPGAFAFGDADRDGDTELAQLSGRLAGRFEHDREARRWRPFRTFAALPHLEALGGRAQWVDLNGDGRDDLVVARSDRLVWFASRGDGFADPVELPIATSALAAPTVAEDPSLNLFFADMDGDGLVDLVRVDNGRIEYWPSLGNGRFGDAVVVEDAPTFAPAGEFDPARVRFVDLDRSGTSDLVYLGHGQVTIWINAGGNRMVPGGTLSGLPYLDNVSSVRVGDFAGDGRPCLIWSSPLPGRVGVHYLPLAGAVPPRALLSVDDSRGRETRLSYSSSASHYLRDAENGRPWSTRLPFHTLVADRREVIDQVRGLRRVERLEYHDGYFDGIHRDSRGFGQVDVYDAETADGAAAGPATEVLATPSVVRTWFHPGAAAAVLGSPTASYREDLELPALPAHVLDDGLSGAELDDALAGLAGSAYRSEIFAVDEHGRAAPHPLQVTQSSFRVRRRQPASGAARGAFSVTLGETVVAVYEGEPGDPRVEHHLVVETDDFDAVTREASIAYPRRSGRALDVAAQGRLEVIVHDHDVVHVDERGRYELGLVIEERSCDLAGAIADGARRVERAQLRAADVVDALASPLPRHVVAPGGVVAMVLQRRQPHYWNDDRSAALPPGQVGALTLVHHEEEACFAPELVSQVFANRVDAARLEGLGYVLRDGLWWLRHDIQHVGGRELFFQRTGVESFDGGRSVLSYDRDALRVIGHVDAAGNRSSATLDHHLVEPARIVDPNGNVTEVRYDALGVAVAASRHGHVGADDWGFAPLAGAIVETATSVAALLAEPERYLGGAASILYYDLHRWRRERSPVPAVQLIREELRADGRAGGGGGTIQTRIAYLDGLGGVVQQKIRIEPGPAIQRSRSGAVVTDAGGQPVLADAAERWQVSGHDVRDFRGRVARTYQPYFSPVPDHEGDLVLASLGASVVTLADALGREAGHVYGDGTFDRVVYGAWSIERADRNDTVLASAYRALREGRAADDPERQAFEHARAHADTPATVFLDPRGRDVALLERGGAGTEDRRTEVRLSPSGEADAFIDPRGLAAVTYRRDMGGRVLLRQTIDAGETRTLPDARDRVVFSWDARDLEAEYRHDRLDRLVSTHVRGGGLDHVVETRSYGEDVPDGARRNACGRVVEVRDQAGTFVVDTYDPHGRAMVTRRRLRSEPGGEVDWRGPVALDDEVFTGESEFDALGRARRFRPPDGMLRTVSYLRGGEIERLAISTADGHLVDVLVIDGAGYDARGARTGFRFGNGVELELQRDPVTARLIRQRAHRGTRIYQDLRCSYDPAGNLVRLEDRAHDGPGALLRGAAVSARRDFSYDAHYRLVRATGRVHQALLEHSFVPGTGGTLRGTAHLSFDNAAALEAYARTYHYDPAGNLLRFGHQGTSQQWSTEMWVSPRSNRSVPVRDPGGVDVVDAERRFDAAGNLIEISHLRALEWSWRGTLARAVSIARPGGIDDAEVYTYDAERLRVRAVSHRVVHGGEVETREKIYFQDCERVRIRRGGNLILERWTSHLGDDGERIAVVHRWSVDRLARETDDVARHRLHYQLAAPQGSSGLELDEEGQLISYEEHFPYGGTAFVAGAGAREVDLKEYRYSGKEQDQATGLYYFGHRYYASWMGRWLSPDPIGAEDDLNLYQFVRGDPIGNLDPDGLRTFGRLGDRESAAVEAAPPSPPPAVPSGAPPVGPASGGAARSGPRPAPARGAPPGRVRRPGSGPRRGVVNAPSAPAVGPVAPDRDAPTGDAGRKSSGGDGEPPAGSGGELAEPADQPRSSGGSRPPPDIQIDPSLTPSPGRGLYDFEPKELREEDLSELILEEPPDPPEHSELDSAIADDVPPLNSTGAPSVPPTPTPTPTPPPTPTPTPPPTFRERVHEFSTGVAFAYDPGPGRLQPIARFDTGYTAANLVVNQFIGLTNLVTLPLNAVADILEPPLAALRNAVGHERFDEGVDTGIRGVSHVLDTAGQVSIATTGAFPPAAAGTLGGGRALRGLAYTLRYKWRDLLRLRQAKPLRPTTSKTLLPNELEIGRYGDLAQTVGDNLTPHHMPSASYMRRKFGIHRDKSLAINVEAPRVNGRHARTETFGRSHFSDELSRDALARDIWDLRKLYQQDGLYGPQVRDALRRYIQESKQLFPTIFSR